MTATIVSFVGAVSGASATGASHAAARTPNQDAVGWRQDRLWTYLAVADGHGSAPHYRSERGSRMAVDAVLTLLRDATQDGSLRDPEALAGHLSGLGVALADAWRARVEADLASDPVPETDGVDRLAVYGSTCLGAAIGPGFTLFVQIGDGALFVGAPSGDVEQVFPNDDYPGEATDSLCLPGAGERAKIGLYAAPSRLCAPDFVLAATDGVTKSYPGPDALLQAMRAARDAVHARDLDRIADDLGPWVKACAERASGDDATLALFAYRADIAADPPVEAYAWPDPSGASRTSEAATAPERPGVRRLPPVATAFGFLVGMIVGHWGLPPSTCRVSASLSLPASLHSTRGPS